MWRPALATAAVVVLFGVSSCTGAELQSPPTSEGSTTTTTPTTTTQATTTTTATTTSVATTTTSTTEPPTFVKTNNVVYNGSETLDIYSPLDAAVAPVVVILHGGAGNPGRYAPLAEALASEGVVVMNVAWPSERPSQRAAEAVACAVRYARVTAADHGGDPGNVVVLGHSAGAAVGSVIALAGDSWTENCPVSGVSGLPEAFVGLAGAYDPTIIPGDARSFLRQTNPELYDQLNPLNHLGSNPSLVVVLLHGDSDNLVPTESSVQFNEALEDAGYDVTLTILEGAGHETLVSPTSDAFAITVALALDVAHRP